jgi:NAD(P)-dependent dehydrogenase (short-subunit alcohol dehydrogenase family)
MSLSGKVAVVTGAGSGIGRAIAQTLGRHGAGVAAADRNLPSVQSLELEMRAQNVTVAPIAVDVSDSSSVDALITQAVSRFGQIDIVAHCAGIAPQGPVLKLTDEAWHRGIGVNLSGAFYLARAAGRVMTERRSGTMVFLASDRGVYGGANCADYAAAKGGVIAFTKSLALELAPCGVTVNAINPGTTDTPLARGNLTEEQWAAKSKSDPLGRFSKPEEIAEIVLFLAQTAGTFMTGQLITTRMRAG